MLTSRCHHCGGGDIGHGTVSNGVARCPRCGADPFPPRDWKVTGLLLFFATGMLFLGGMVAAQVFIWVSK